MYHILLLANKGTWFVVQAILLSLSLFSKYAHFSFFTYWCLDMHMFIVNLYLNVFPFIFYSTVSGVVYSAFLHPICLTSPTTWSTTSTLTHTPVYLPWENPLLPLVSARWKCLSLQLMMDFLTARQPSMHVLQSTSSEMRMIRSS